MFVECKRYASRGGQLKEFRRFLAIAYSAHVKGAELYGKWAEDFIWVTSNPFETDKWPKLCTEEQMFDALADPAHLDVLGQGHEIDEKLAREVVGRVWLLVFDERKQIDVTLTSSELKRVMTLLEREGAPLWQH